jgi:hypothetical protein
MRVPPAARVLIACVTSAGAAVAAASVPGVLGASTAPLALLAAAAVLTELIRVPSDDRSPDPADANEFSFSSGVQMAAVLVLGPWAAALVAGFGVVAADGMRGARWRQVSYNAAVFMLATLAGGGAFVALGGRPGALDLPADFVPVAALGLTHYAVNTVLVSGVVALTGGGRIFGQALATARGQLLSAVGEVGFGVALAFFALAQPWAAVVLAPLVLALFQAHSRLAQLRRETARALETFANVVDERDPYTYRHSERVSEHVYGLAAALGLSPTESNRLRWAGRLHDLGKIAVDSSILRKPGRLTDAETDTMRRHPRLSARLIRPFRFAADEARAVEYHHERFDGGGYYGVDASALPLAAHFLIVADSFDAMTSDRSYRRALSKEQALAEIEGGASRQFDPLVARAFVALERGLDPAAVLSRDELRRLRGPLWSGAAAGRWRRPAIDLRLAGPCLVVAGLVAIGAGMPGLGLAALAGGGFALARQRLEARRALRLAERLRAAVAGGGAEPFRALVGALARETHLSWAALVSLNEREPGGAVVDRFGDDLPADGATLSWLVRDLDARDPLRVGHASELGGAGSVAVLSLGADAIRAGFVVLAFGGRLPSSVEEALRRSADRVSAAVAPLVQPAAPVRRRLAAL